MSAPTTFIPLAHVIYNPAGGSPISDRVAITTSTGTPLAQNVSQLKFDFSEQDGYLDNGASLYAEIIVEGTNSLPPVAPPSPYLTQDTVPGYAETVVGDQVILTAAYSNFPPVSLQWQVITNGVTNNINTGVVNVTNNDNVTSTLTLNNLQTNNSGLYLLKATNATNSAGVSYGATSSLVVGSMPAAVNNVIMEYAGQSGVATGGAGNFIPTWIIDTNNDLILGAVSGAPLTPGQFVPGSGDFGTFGVNPDPAILTDGAFGYEPYAAYPTVSSTLVSCGVSGAGDVITYTLDTSAAPNGFDLTNIVVYGGWNNTDRNEQKYEVLYSTVASPSSFVSMGIFDYNPNGLSGIPSAGRTSLVSASGAMARGVKSVKFNWNLQNPIVENGVVGYSEIIVKGKASPPVPTLVANINPVTAQDVAGSQLTITASFSGATSYQWLKDGSNILGATSSTLTLAILQLTDTATNSGYSLVASNSSGASVSAACAVTVKPVPATIHNVIAAFAVQTETGNVGPTWDTSAIGSGLNLILNATPSIVDTNNFLDPDHNARNHNTAGGIPILTDGNFGAFSDVNDLAFATCGPGGFDSQTGEQAGQFVAYNLPATVNGYDLTNIVIAGGWNDIGRECQQYTILYSTVANTNMFIPLMSVSNNPALTAKTVVRGTYAAGIGVLARNVYAVYVDFTQPPLVPNGWSGYSEIALFGSASTSAYVPPTTPTVTSTVVSGNDLAVTGSGGTAFYPYSWLSTTNLTTPVANWNVISAGFLDGSGSFSNSIPLDVNNPASFFRLRMP